MAFHLARFGPAELRSPSVLRQVELSRPPGCIGHGGPRPWPCRTGDQDGRRIGGAPSVRRRAPSTARSSCEAGSPSAREQSCGFVWSPDWGILCVVIRTGLLRLRVTGQAPVVAGAPVLTDGCDSASLTIRDVSVDCGCARGSPAVGRCRRASTVCNLAARGCAVAVPRRTHRTWSGSDAEACCTTYSGLRQYGPAATGAACSAHVSASMASRIRQLSTRGCGCIKVISSSAFPGDIRSNRLASSLRPEPHLQQEGTSHRQEVDHGVEFAVPSVRCP